jgi:hypothetical protein
LFASCRHDGNNGRFFIPSVGTTVLMCVVSDGANWEHVSVSVKIRNPNDSTEMIEAQRCPTWEEMCRVKDLFFEAEECVIQYHPRVSEYRNYHNYVLHLWRPTAAVIPEPPADFVAPRPGESVDELAARYRETA